MKDSVRIGIVGCGGIGQAHLQVWSELDCARVTAVCDSVRERAADVARQLGATPFDNLQAMCESGLIDAVDICTPSGLHAEQGLVAVQHGLHVLCEKPLDLVPARAEALVNAAERTGVRVACVLQRRAFRGPRVVADAVREGRLGRLLSCSAYVKWWRDQAYYNSAGWRGTRSLDGGVLANQGIHALDHLCWLAGRVTQVEFAEARTVCHEMEAEDWLVAVVRFESGAVGVIEATTCCRPPLCSRVEVVGTNGAAAFDDAQVTHFGYGGSDYTEMVREESARLGGRAEALAINLDGHRAILHDFALAVLEGRDPCVSGRDALASVQALDAIYRAAGLVR